MYTIISKLKIIIDFECNLHIIYYVEDELIVFSCMDDATYSTPITQKKKLLSESTKWLVQTPIQQNNFFFFFYRVDFIVDVIFCQCDFL